MSDSVENDSVENDSVEIDSVEIDSVETDPVEIDAVKVAALIPAAGLGTRLGRGPKAFVALAGQPLIARTVAAFRGVVDEVVVAVSAEMMGGARALLPTTPKTTLCEGGTTRQQTVYRLLQSTDADIVLIHDAARPFLSPDIIRTTIETVRRCGAASVVKPVADTLIDKDSGNVIDRDQLRAVQTPQGFRRALILNAHERALADGVAATDDAGLVRRIGHAVALVEGSSWLLKITTPADFEMAEALAAVWDGVYGDARGEIDDDA